MQEIKLFRVTFKSFYASGSRVLVVLHLTSYPFLASHACSLTKTQFDSTHTNTSLSSYYLVTHTLLSESQGQSESSRVFSTGISAAVRVDNSISLLDLGGVPIVSPRQDSATIKSKSACSSLQYSIQVPS